MLVPNRHGSSDAYRYGFNGKEKDDEIKGEGLQYDYGFRIYDPRIGKFLSTDPLFAGYPYYTPYQFAGNRPIWAIDLDGLEQYTKTSTRIYSISYIKDSQGDMIEGTYTFYLNDDDRKMTVTSGEKLLIRNGEEGGAIMLETKYYKVTDQGRKDGLRRAILLGSSNYEGIEGVVPADPNNHNDPISNVEEIKTKPVTKTVTSTKVKKSAVNKSKPKPRPSDDSGNKNTRDQEVLIVGSLDALRRIEFVKNKVDFKTSPSAAFDEVAAIIRGNSKNTAIIYNVTPLSKGTEVEFNFFEANTKIDAVMEGREKSIRDELDKRGVKGKYSIKTSYGVKGMQNMSGTVIEYKKVKK
jgi:RHS repeat-associated protein